MVYKTGSDEDEKIKIRRLAKNMLGIRMQMDTDTKPNVI